MIFSRDELLVLIDLVGRRLCTPATDHFPYEVITAESKGVHPDPRKERIQRKLVLLLESLDVDEGTPPK